MSSINREALFSDTTEYYVHPAEPMAYDNVDIRFRTAKDDADKVSIVVGERILPMYRAGSCNGFDYYLASLGISNQKMCYHFKIQKEDEVVYFNMNGAVDEAAPYFEFRLIPGYHTPDWAKGAVFYQIYVDRFCDGDPTNNVVDHEYTYIGEHVNEVKDWGKYPASMGVREFYGGDLAGVLKKLDYLQELGVEVIYLNPMFVSPSNHKYDTQDYDYIDPHFTVIKEDGGEPLAQGDRDNSHASKYQKRVTDPVNLEASNEYFAKFVEEVHRRGMKVILDGVFNHCGSFNKWLDRERIYESQDDYEKGAFVSENSPYRTFFKFREEEWPYNERYDGWWGHDTLPKLNYEESPKLFSYIMRIAKKWVSPPYNVDGWRLDVAADLGHTTEYNHKFWQEFRRTVKEANPNAIILAEHYGDASSWLSGGEWDTVMNYDAFMEPITWFLTGMDKHSDVYRPDLMGNADAFWDSMRRYSAKFTMQSLQVAMNELSNHDHSRFLTRTNHRVGRVTFSTPEAAEHDIDRSLMMEAVVFQMTWLGAPTVYYGDEAGVCGWTDPDNRRTYPWGHEDKELLLCHKEMIRIHRDYKAFRKGSTIRIMNRQDLLCFGRFTNKERILVVLFVGDYDLDIDIPIWKMGGASKECYVRLAKTSYNGFSLKTDITHCTDGMLHIHLTPHMSVVYKNLIQ